MEMKRTHSGRVFVWLVGGVLMMTPLLAGQAAAVTRWPVLRTTASVSGLSSPTMIVAPDDRSGRLFVTEQGGRIRIVRNGSLVPTIALDIRSLVSTGGERGLLGLAFPPGFAKKRYAYVHYTDRAGAVTIARFRLSAHDPDRFVTSSRQIILRVSHPLSNHNGGQIAFGADGYLYIGIGDGGGGGDPNNRARNLGSLLGKILRINTESRPSRAGYSVPSTNPFVGKRGRRAEIWAYGLRNPWRFSFDRPTKTLWIGDVGQNKWEEIDRVAGGGRGGYDFGWSLYEGNHTYKRRTIVRTGFRWPIAEYSHAEGESVTGGYVYRGKTNPAMAGIYYFGDYSSGRIWGLQKSGGKWVRKMLVNTSRNISTFGVDGSGELWYADYAGGVIYRLGASATATATGAPATGSTVADAATSAVPCGGLPAR